MKRRHIPGWDGSSTNGRRQTWPGALLGQTLVRVRDGARLAGTIVEVEAYLGIPDRAAHTYGGRRTARNESMWWDGGHAYVYFTYGMHHCVNVVAGTEGDPVAVLVRALEPVEGREVMRGLRRGGHGGEGPTAKTRPGGWPRDTDLCSGPAKLCQALGIDRDLDGADMTRSGALFLERARRRPVPDDLVHAGPRVGVGYAGSWADEPLRFYLKDNPHVSRPR